MSECKGERTSLFVKCGASCHCCPPSVQSVLTVAALLCETVAVLEQAEPDLPLKDCEYVSACILLLSEDERAVKWWQSRRKRASLLADSC